MPELLRRDYPGGPVVKTLPFNVGCAGSIPGRGVKIPHASQSKNPNIKNRSYIVTNSKKTLNMIHIKKILKKKELLLRKPRNPKFTAYNLKVFEKHLVTAVSCE